MIVSSASRIGCLPRGERSMIERRRWPKPRAWSSLVKKPESSGPRWTSESVIEERSDSIVLRLKSHKPAIPHIQLYTASYVSSHRYLATQSQTARLHFRCQNALRHKVSLLVSAIITVDFLVNLQPRSHTVARIL